MASSPLALPYSADDDGMAAGIERFVSQAHLAPDSRASYRFAAKSFVAFASARRWRSANEAISAWANDLVEKKLSTNTIHLYVAAARGYVAFLGHPPGKVKLPRKPRGYLKDPLTPEEFRKLLDAYPGDDAEATRNRAIVALMGVTGVRGIEVQRADAEDLRNVGRTVLHVQRKGAREKDSFVVIPPALLQMLREWLKLRDKIMREAQGARRKAQDAADEVALGAPRLAPSSALFVSVSKTSGTYGERLGRSTVRWIVDEGLRRAGLKGLGKRISPHSLRHTAGTTARRGGAKLDAVQDMLAHRDINMTRRYEHSLDRLKDPAEDRAADALLLPDATKDRQARSR